MLYDYGGFPPESYTLKYPAPGSPQLAERIAGMLQSAGVPVAKDSRRGFDHGTFVPLMLMFPEADIPVVQMSVLSSQDPQAHIEVRPDACCFELKSTISSLPCGVAPYWPNGVDAVNSIGTAELVLVKCCTPVIVSCERDTDRAVPSPPSPAACSWAAHWHHCVRRVCSSWGQAPPSTTWV